MSDVLAAVPSQDSVSGDRSPAATRPSATQLSAGLGARLWSAKRRFLIVLLIVALLTTASGLVMHTAAAEIAGVLLFFAVCGFGGYADNWSWTGVGPMTRSQGKQEDRPQGKTLWDVLQLLVLPAILTFGVVWFNDQQSAAAEKRAEVQTQDAAARAQVQARDAVLSSYLSQMSNLILKDGLEPSPTPQVRAIARAQTLTTLSELDPGRRSMVVRFLVESNLVGVVDLSIINLQGVSLQGFQFTCDPPLPLHTYCARFGYAWLDDHTDLSYSTLARADLDHAHLDGANLSHADLRRANLAYADLRSANLSHANLFRADLFCLPATGRHSGCAPAPASEVARSLAGVRWHHTTCPDGTRSNTNGSQPESCLGHLGRRP